MFNKHASAYVLMWAVGPVAATLIGTSAARADSYLWVPSTNATYNWNSSANWTPSGSGLYPSIAGDVANLNNNISGGVLTASLSAPVSVGTLNLGDSDGTNSFTIASNTLTFQTATAGGQAVLALSAAGSVNNTISSSIALGGTSSLLISAAGGQTVTTSSTFNAGSNNISISGGTAQTALWTISGDLTGNGTITIGSSGGVAVNGSKSFTGTFVLNKGVSSSSNSGALTVNSGSVANAAEIIVNGYLSGAVSPASSSSVQNGGVLHGGNSGPVATNPGQRITQNTITLNGGSLENFGQAATVGTANDWQKGLEYVSESVATLNVNSGGSLISTGQGGNTLGTKLAINTLKRGAGATLFVKSQTLGTASQISASNGADFLVGGGGANNSTTMSIIPWMVANGTSAGTGNPVTFATIDSSTGLIRQLTTGSSSESSTSITAGSTSNVNVSALTITNNTTVNSLRFSASSASNITNNQSTGSDRTLTVTSGGVIMSSDGGSIGTAGGTRSGVLDFGNAEAVIWNYVTNTNTIASAITGSGGLTKAGTGTLVLAGSNSYTGTTTVSEGKLRVGNGTQTSTLGSGAHDNVVVANGATLELSNVNAIGDQATLSLDAYGLFNGMINIDSGIETVGAFKIGGVFQPVGTYGRTGSGATFTSALLDNYFTAGTGILNVTAVPEPTSMSILGFGAVAFLTRRPRGRR